MRLAQDDEMVHTLAPDRSDQPFGKAILPRRGWCGRPVPDAHGAQSACDDGAVNPIPIANEVLRGHCQSKFVYFPKTSEPDFAAIDFPAFFRVDLSGSMAAPSI